MRLLTILTLIIHTSCTPLTKYNRQLRSLDRYIERNDKKEQRQLEREFKRQSQYNLR